MGLSSFLLKWLAKKEYKKYSSNKQTAIKNQSEIFNKILLRGSQSLFWKQNKLPTITKYSEYNHLVPISDYESIRPFISKISNLEQDVLTRGGPLYFAITSGTTSGKKYIPLTREMLAFQTQAIKELLLLYAYQTNNYNISPNVGMMFIQGSPELQYFNKIPFAKLSGITARHVPFFLKKNRYPSMETNCIENWGEKIKAIVQETHNKDMQIIGGIPPWVLTYLEELLKFKNTKDVIDVFPNLM